MIKNEEPWIVRNWDFVRNAAIVVGIVGGMTTGILRSNRLEENKLDLLTPRQLKAQKDSIRKAHPHANALQRWLFE